MSRKRRKTTRQDATAPARSRSTTGRETASHGPSTIQSPAKAETRRVPPTLSRGKKVAFAFVTTIAVLGLAELLLWTGGVRPVTTREDPYLGFTSVNPLFVEKSTADGTTTLETAPGKLRHFNRQEFVMPKPAGVRRIFCVGGSTTFGHPFDDRTSFCGWLRELLKSADTSHTWEVINCGGISYASYRDAVIIDEVSRYEPDLVVIYGSQNEFIENRTYRGVIETPPAIRGLGALVARTRLYAATKWATDAIVSRPAGDDRTVLDDEVKTRLDRTIGPADYTRDDDLRRQIIDHLRFNTARMIDTARAAGAKVLLVSPASNLRDCSPFKSQHRGEVAASPERRQAFDHAMRAARGALAAGKPDGALTAVDRALQLDDRYADAHFLRGQVLDLLQRPADAHAAYQRAIDEDVCPLRADSELVAAMKSVAEDRAAPLVDFVDLVARRSPGGSADRTLFLDHVHPTIEGSGLLAQAILDELEHEGFAAPRSGWKETVYVKVAQQIESSIDDATRATALQNLAKVFEWAGKIDEAKRFAVAANRAMPPDAEGRAESLYRIGSAAAKQGKWKEAIAAYEQCIAIAPNVAITHNALGGLYEEQGRVEEALAHYRRAVEFARSDRPQERSQSRTLVGGALAKLNRFDEAIGELRAVIRDDPKYAEAYRRLGIVYFQRQNYDAALEQFAEADRRSPRNASVLRNWGLTLLRLGKYSAASNKLQVALEIEPDHAKTHANMAETLRGLGDGDGAEYHYREAVRLDNELVAARAGLAKLLVEHRKLEEADGVLRGARSPEMSEAILNLAWRLATSPNSEERNGNRAVFWAERLRRDVGDMSPAVLDALAAAYAEAGRYDEAVRTANLAVAAALGAMDDRLARDARARLDVYRMGRPFRDQSLQ